MRGCLKVLVCFPGINIKTGIFMLAILCRMIQKAECLLKDLNDNWGQLNGCWHYCFHLFLPPALHRYWAACQSADELSQLPSWHFMLCHSVNQWFRMWLLNHVETPWKCEVKPHQSLRAKLCLIAIQSSALRKQSKKHQRKQSFWARERYFGGQMTISALHAHQSNRE